MVLVEKINSLLGHRDCVYTLAAGSKDDYFLSAAGDGFVVEWETRDPNPENARVLANAGAPVYAVKYSPVHKMMFVGQKNGLLYAINAEKKEVQKSLQVSSLPIFDIQLSPREDLLAVAAGDGRVSVFSLPNLQCLYSLPLAEESAALKNVRSLAFSPDGKHLAVGISDHTAQILDAQHFGKLHTLKAHTNSVFCVAYSPDGKYLLTGSRDANLKIWDVENNYALRESVVAHLFAINCIVFSPDGKHFATASADKTIKIWQTQGFKLLKVIDRLRNQSHSTSVNKLYWQGQTQQLLSCSDDKSIIVWGLDIRSEQPE